MPSKFWGNVTLFGIGISFVSNHRDALSAALSVFEHFELTESSSKSSSIYIVLAARDFRQPISDCTRIKEYRLFIVRDGIAVRANGRSGRGVCLFPRRARDGSGFREAIRTLALFLVAHAGRIPVHASAIVIGHTAIVLAGKSGSGKSSLALAADRAGLPILSEDTVYVQLEPPFRIWALPEAIHLSEADAPAESRSRIRIRSGRLKRAIPIANARWHAERARLCILARGDAISLEEIHSDEAVRLLTASPEPGFEFYGIRSELAIRAIAARGSWRLTLSRDPRAAIAALVIAFSRDSGCHKCEEQSV